MLIQKTSQWVQKTTELVEPFDSGDSSVCKKVSGGIFFSQASTITTAAGVVKMSRPELTAVQVAGDGGMGEEEVVEVGVLLE